MLKEETKYGRLFKLHNSKLIIISLHTYYKQMGFNIYNSEISFLTIRSDVVSISLGIVKKANKFSLVKLQYQSIKNHLYSSN